MDILNIMNIMDMIMLSTSEVSLGQAVIMMFIVYGDNDGDGGDSK